MKLTLKQELRPRPFGSVLGLLDLKTGVTVVVLFASPESMVLIAMLTGAGGNAAQLTLYIYSVLALAALAWGLRTINDENPKHMLYFAHVFSPIIFSTPPGQFILPFTGQHQDMSADERAAAAERVWRAEKGQALTIIILGWLIKFYFAALLYSFAHHLRRGSYRALSFSRTHHANGTTTGNTPPLNDPSALPALDSDNGDDSIETDVDLESFYGATPTLPVHSVPPPSGINGSGASHRSRSSGTGSAGSFADFVSAPPPKRVRPTRGSLLAGGARRSGSTPGSVAGSSSAGPSEGEDDEVSSAGTGTSRVRA
ncbi:hypothetical protein BJY52DRAFT_1400378 [Lactarius psammicola]|nr:hypothetical protein BJY52DRAFT_1400378 [Lactarius psammicola]